MTSALPTCGELLLALSLGTALLSCLAAIGGDRWRRISRLAALARIPRGGLARALALEPRPHK